MLINKNHQKHKQRQEFYCIKDHNVFTSNVIYKFDPTYTHSQANGQIGIINKDFPCRKSGLLVACINNEEDNGDNGR